jgi:hypothetical protein
MSQYAVELPEALVHEAHEVATAAHTSFDEFVRAAIAEKIAAARTAQYVRTRAARADPQAFQVVLERIKQAAGPVVEGDALEERGSEHRGDATAEARQREGTARVAAFASSVTCGEEPRA